MSPADDEGIRPPEESGSDAGRVAPTETYVDLMERLAPGTRVANRYVIAGGPKPGASASSVMESLAP